MRRFGDLLRRLKNWYQLANVAKQAKSVLETETLEAVADRGYFTSPDLACHEAGITVTLPKPLTSEAKSDGRFGKQDFVYLADEDVYRCPAGERLRYRYTNEEAGKVLRRYWTNVCSKCPLKSQCTTGPERRVVFTSDPFWRVDLLRGDAESPARGDARRPRMRSAVRTM